MSIFISNALYLDATGGGGSGGDVLANKPIIGWHSVLRIDDITTQDAAEGRPARNLWSPDTATFWQGTELTNYIELANTGGSVDYIGIAKHNLGTAQIPYKIQKSVDGSTWVDVTAYKIVPSDRAILEYFDAITSPFIRIFFNTSAISGVVPIIAHIKLGRALVLPNRQYVGQKPPLNPRVKRITQTSQSGQYLGQVVLSQYHEAYCKQDHVNPLFMRNYVVPFIDHCNGVRADNGTPQVPFFYSWRPISYPDEVVYGWLKGEIVPENKMNNGLMGFDFDMECIV